MYQEWIEKYEKIKKEGKSETEYCPMCGKKIEMEVNNDNSKSR